MHGRLRGISLGLNALRLDGQMNSKQGYHGVERGLPSPHDGLQDLGEGCSLGRWGWTRRATMSKGLKPEKS